MYVNSYFEIHAIFQINGAFLWEIFLHVFKVAHDRKIQFTYCVFNFS